MVERTRSSLGIGLLVFGGGLVVGSSTIWLGNESVLTLIVAGTGISILVLISTYWRQGHVFMTSKKQY